MFRIIVISAGGILVLSFSQPASECGVWDEFFIERLEITGPRQSQGIGDLRPERVPERSSRDPRERELRQRRSAAGIPELLSVGPNPADFRGIAAPGDHVL